MRILQLHCNYIEYTPIKKEIVTADQVDDKSTVRLDEIMVAFVAVERGDNATVGHNATLQVVGSMEKMGCKRLLLYPYAHLSADLARPADAMSVMGKMQETAIEAGIQDVFKSPFGWTKSYNVSVKGHPLAESSKVVTVADVLKTKEGSDVHGHGDKREGGDNDDTTSTSPASTHTTNATTSTALSKESGIKSHWMIMSPDGTMTDVEKYNFAGHKNLEILAKYESAKQRQADQPPHVVLMKKMAIADYEPASDPGNMRFFPNGRLIKSLIERYVGERVRQYGGCEVETPIMYDSQHPSMVSYFNRFPARQYSIDSDGKSLFLRFAACFGQFLMANQFQLSYKSLPYRLYELARYSFRREQSGELVGLRRLRAFTMPDCHAFCRDMEQAVEEIKVRFDLSRDVLSELGVDDTDYEMAIRFTEDFYAQNRQTVEELVKRHARPVLVEMWKEKFFYFVLKWEFNFIDNLKKAAALATDQIDVENGERYNIQFVDENNALQYPIILHNSPSGAVERIIYALLEKAAKDSRQGRKPQLPLWLAPTQARVIPLKEEFVGFCEGLAGKLSEGGARVDIDDRNESIAKRIREAEKEWIRYIVVIGEKEAVSGEALSVRDRTVPREEAGSIRRITTDELLAEITSQTAGKPSSGLNMPMHLSKRPTLMV